MSGIRTRRSEIDYVVLLSLRQRHCRRRSPALLTAYPGLFAVGSRRLEIVLPVACRRIRFSHPNGICRGISGRKQPVIGTIPSSLVTFYGAPTTEHGLNGGIWGPFWFSWYRQPERVVGTTRVVAFGDPCHCVGPVLTRRMLPWLRESSEHRHIAWAERDSWPRLSSPRLRS